MDKNLVSRWKWGVIAALAMTFLTLLPQVNLWLMPERQWQGSYALMHADEVAYSAYINALIDGRPRRNDPYAGRDDRPEEPRPESLFSIQIVPAYAIAVPARLFGLSASSAFILLTIISTLLSTLAIFWLLKSLAGDERLAAAGALFVLCFGALIATYGEVGMLVGQPAGYIAIPFTRRYQPAAAFPVLFLFCGLVWSAFTSEKQRTAILSAVGAGLCFAVLIFSYFYLWTAAAAWFAGLILLFFALRLPDWKRNLTATVITGVIALAALIPYLLLLANRAKSIDETQALTFTRVPDLFRPVEITGFVVLLVIIAGVWRGVFSLKDNLVLFTASFALLPVIVFNQQVITGMLLQPVHYELYNANYISLIAVVLIVVLVWREWLKREVPQKALMWIAILALGWCAIEITGLIKRDAEYAKIHDDAMPMMARLKELAKTDGTYGGSGSAVNTQSVVLIADNDFADVFPSGAPQPVLWALHIPVFSTLQPGESKDRFYQYLYYTGTKPKDLAEAIRKRQHIVIGAIFGYERALPALSTGVKPITADEELAELRYFTDYGASFTKEKAAQLPLSYVISPVKDEPDFSNIDRWYERDAGEVVGKWKLYRVKLRQ